MTMTLLLGHAAPARANAAEPGPAAVAATGLRPGLRLPGGARLLDARPVGRRILDVVLDSVALGGRGAARIMLPPDYGRSHHRRWPVLYLLHGCCQPDPGWTVWTANTDVERLTARYNAIVVMPDGGTYGYYSNWWNGGDYGVPEWERFHLQELKGLLEHGLRAGRRRSIAGFSMGGFGALSYAARYPRMFRAAASYSGLTDSVAAAEQVLAVLRGFGGDPLALWGDPVEQEDVWRRHNPHDLVAELRSIPLYIAAGDGRPGPLDPPGGRPDPIESWVGPMNSRFVDRARSHGVQVTANLYGAGTHTWPYWERELRRSLPWLMASVGAEERTGR